MVRENRKSKLDYYRSYDMRRAMEPHRIEARSRYAKSESGRLVCNAAKARWLDRNPAKKKAACAVSNAVRDGVLLKQPCEVCGFIKAQAHHDDYSKPLEVRWLCTKHHKPADRIRRSVERGLICAS